MLSRNEYDAWLMSVGYDPDQVSDTLTATLLAHVQALQDRIDKLPHPDNSAVYAGLGEEYVTQCACAYDYPDAICGVHQAREEKL